MLNFVKTSSLLFIALLSMTAMFTTLAVSQNQNTSSGETTIEGTIVSSSRDTLVVRTDDNAYQLFIYDNDIAKPRSLSPGSRVRVVSIPSDEAGARVAGSITILSGTTSSSASTSETGRSTASNDQAPVPQQVRDLERDIRRGVRRWRVGVRAGMALDPELALFGVQSQIGPIFSRNISFRPNAEFAWGEVTDMVALNLEAVYRLPISQRQGRWSSYVGAGPSLNFIHQGFTHRDISFGNFDYDTGFNILAGIQHRRGTFVEAKTSIYSRPAPTFRLIVGYNF